MTTSLSSVSVKHSICLQGSVTRGKLLEPEGWGQWVGCDAALSVEVVEHLRDPDSFAKCLLGCLRSVFTFVSYFSSFISTPQRQIIYTWLLCAKLLMFYRPVLGTMLKFDFGRLAQCREQISHCASAEAVARESFMHSCYGVEVRAALVLPEAKECMSKACVSCVNNSVVALSAENAKCGYVGMCADCVDELFQIRGGLPWFRERCICASRNPLGSSL
jgi:hypothetical protein